jgi:CxxC motif-containing protein (DUF1111 family)
VLRRSIGVLVVAAAGTGAAVVLVDGRPGPVPPADPERGRRLFQREFTADQGLGPLFNERSCVACHGEPAIGGGGRGGLATVLRVGRLDGDRFAALPASVAHAHAISELGVECDRVAGVPAGANVTSVRNAPPLFGSGLIDAIPEGAILDEAVRKPGGVHGRPNLVRGPDGRERVGRFGWKADTPSLSKFVAEALRGELGVTSALAPEAPLSGPRCPGESAEPEAGDRDVRDLVAFVASLAQTRPRGDHPEGEAVFKAAGCAACHTPVLGRAQLYSDLLLHDMGPALDDRVVQGRANGREWRTAPLWGLSQRRRFLHDGRATTLRDAIVAHGGEAEGALRRYRALATRRRRALLEFLRTR